jgi:hypothetical protein
MSKDYGFVRFFNLSKSPRGGMQLDGTIYYPKHRKPKGTLVWNSSKKGTYIRKIHGELKF